ncbi:MAG: AzlC family ABC transporter permease [Clostridia bacterium]|nr:AzlC family ABC transporter permease [Clostridia bacterium]
MKKKKFRQGLKDGISIGLGYLSVSVGIGITAVSSGMQALTAVLMSMTNLTSAGQAAGIAVIATGGALLEMALVQLVINLRYSLMAISLSQKVDSGFSTGKRLFLGAFITDEIFAVASTQDEVCPSYMYGLIIIPYIGWALGTVLGAVAGTVLPFSVITALSMAIYGMFIAIFVPAMKKSPGVVIAVLIAATISAILKVVPVFSCISYGFSVIIASVTGAVAASFISWRKRSK